MYSSQKRCLKSGLKKSAASTTFAQSFSTVFLLCINCMDFRYLQVWSNRFDVPFRVTAICTLLCNFPNFFDSASKHAPIGGMLLHFWRRLRKWMHTNSVYNTNRFPQLHTFKFGKADLQNLECVPTPLFSLLWPSFNLWRLGTASTQSHIFCEGDRTTAMQRHTSQLLLRLLCPWIIKLSFVG
jgi:hypothetical protein